MSDIVSKQKVVTFTYSILDSTGEVLEQSDIPLSYLHGVDGKMYEKVEQQMEGRRVGDEVKVTLPPEEGFGQRDPERTFSDSIDNVPPEYRHLGAEAIFQNEQGEQITMTVTKIENGMITLDGNHQFAGKTITFVIRIIGVRDATMEEVGRGEVLDGNTPPSLH